MDQFMTQLSQHLLQHNYTFIETNHSSVRSYLKREQTHIYIVNVIKADAFSIDQWAIALKTYEESIRSYFGKVPSDRKFILNIFVGEDEIPGLYSGMKDIPVEYDRDIISIHWFVDLVNQKLLIPKDHPNRILGIEKIINQLLQGQSHKIKKTLSLEPKTMIPWMTFILLLVNVIIWASMEYAGGSTRSDILIHFGAAQPDLIIYQHQYWRILTSMFLHIGFMHLLYNNIALFIFGIRLERYLGHKVFFDIYLISGIMGSLLSLIVSWYSGDLVISAGASGAIFGIQGAAFILAFKSKGYIFDLSAFMIGIIMAVGLMMGFAYPNIDNFAHVGGLLGGIISGFVYAKMKNNEAAR